MQLAKRIVYTLLVLLALSAAVCAFAFAWSAVQNVSRGRRLERQEQVNAEQKNISALRREQGSWKNAASEYRAFIARYFIPRNDFSTFRRRLNELLEANLFTKQSLVFHTSALAGGYQKVNIQFTVNGSYPAVKKLVHDISALDSLVILNQLALTGGADRQVNAQLQLEVYLE
jgi:Tfp pilus assembly protein PilO